MVWNEGDSQDLPIFQRYRATELVVLLGWDYKDWQGTAIKELLANTEKKYDGRNTHLGFSVTQLVQTN
ncbi:hypothetical protein ANCCAN_19561 [Ancylostoma caninum]|uniref:Uncharacterized protein n=1 Tax=Ancylostoma caninum TaxID=29170 RepID=A0A368FR01_ANCCA|nr:hypothetical protein ANCCAN_19561 [Ancylostoma caninum]